MVYNRSARVYTKGYMARRIGIYSGTFDPVHAGHIAFANATLRECQLDEVIFLPEKQPRNKVGVTDISHRLALLKTATADTPGLRALELPCAQFTPTQTLRELRQLLGQAELTLLVGSDVAKHLLDWPGVDMLLSAMSLVVGLRAGDSREEIAPALHYSPATFIETEFSHLSSSQLRLSTRLGVAVPASPTG